MSQSQIVRMSAAYRAEYRNRKDPDTHAIWAYETFPVSIRVVEADHAPLAYSLPWKDGTLNWRMVEGTLMRPMLDDDGTPCTADALSHHFENVPKNFPWFVSGFYRDHPETIPVHAVPRALSETRRTRSRESVEAGENDYKTAEFWKWTLDERESAEQRANRVAADDLAIIDGILHRRAMPPIIRVALSTGQRGAPAVEVTACIPEDYNTHEGTVSTSAYCFFALEDLSLAESFAQHLVDEKGEWAAVDRVVVSPELSAAEAFVDTRSDQTTAATVSILAFGMHNMSRRIRDSDSVATLTATTLLEAASRCPVAGGPTIAPAEAYGLFVRFADEHGVEERHRSFARVLAEADTFRERMALAHDLRGVSI